MTDLLKQHPAIALGVVALGILLAWGFWPQAVPVEVDITRRAPMAVTIDEEGRTRVIDRYVVSAPVDGVACRVRLDVGDPVTQGEVLLEITPLQSQVLDARSRAEAQARVSAAQAALRGAREQALGAAADDDYATLELQRLQPLMEQGLIAREAFDRARTRASTAAASRRSAEFSVEVARYELEAARTALEYSAGSSRDTAGERVPVASPITGRILKVEHECEGAVRTGEPLFEVGDPNALEIEVDVLSADAVRIKPGMDVRFDRWGGDQPLQGVVRNVEPIGFTKISALGIEEQRVLVISDFVSPPQQWERLGDGYRVEAQFVLWQEDNVLQVPDNSLFRHGDGWAVFVEEDGRAVRRPVRVGQQNGLAAQILDGVSEGDAVIIHPSDAVEHGVRLRRR